MRTLADPASQIKCPANACEDMLSVRAFLLTASLRTERLDIVFVDSLWGNPGGNSRAPIASILVDLATT